MANSRSFDGDTIRATAKQVGEVLDGVNRPDNWSAGIYGRACFMAGIEQLRRVMDEADVISYLRAIADDSEAILRHAHAITGKVFGQRNG